MQTSNTEMKEHNLTRLFSQFYCRNEPQLGEIHFLSQEQTTSTVTALVIPTVANETSAFIPRPVHLHA